MFQHLWRHVDRSTHTGPCHFACLSKKFCKTEIANFENLLMDQDVGCFQVTMDDAKFAELLEAFSNLAYDVKGEFLIDLSSHAISL